MGSDGRYLMVEVEPGTHPNAEEALREALVNRLMAPSKSIGLKYGWHLREVTVDGRRLWRFSGRDNETDTGFHTTRLTRMGMRLTIWVDPETRRVVRQESEMYDGDTHSVMVCDGYVYDQPLADSLFARTKEWPGWF